MKVMRVIARMNVGGPALQVAGLVEGIDPERFDHRLYVGHVAPDEGDHLVLRAPDLPFRRIEGLGRSPSPLADARALRDLVQEMRRFKPDVVHTHTAKAGVLGRVAARLSGVPITVHTFHGHLLHGYFPRLVTRGVTQVERLLARHTTRLLAVGEQVRDDLLSAGVGRPEQYLVVPPGITISALPARAAARAALGIGEADHVVSFVARLTSVKQPGRVIEVARRIAAVRDDVTFVICGAGELFGDLKADATGCERVRFLGWRADVETVYAASDLVLLTSDNEGMPVSLIEAALCGVPAVATDVGSVREVVLDGRTGWLCEPSTEALTAVVDAALSDPDRLRSAGQAAREHATGAFSRDRLVADTERLYEQIAAEKGLSCGLS